VKPAIYRRVIVISISTASIQFNVPFMESVSKSGTSALKTVRGTTPAVNLSFMMDAEMEERRANTLKKPRVGTPRFSDVI
jgi:hypothetical protein